jgi:hypothetical protein
MRGIVDFTRYRGTRRASIAGVIRHVLVFAAWFCQSCC